ncbi:hypothetical protein tpqmel_0313 [Candidatus Gastranaerophilus sp. (ex Termes propinquus)]|nr:hypothetical protein tpqmel_0313 [Candidatus Gastranaerophilus sp. (ex Termes propinquus)]
MLNKKLATALLVPLMFTAIGVAKAACCGGLDNCGCGCGCDQAEVPCAASCDVTAELGKHCKISVSPSSVTDVTINPENGHLSQALAPTFQIMANYPISLRMYAECETSDGARQAFSEHALLLALANDKVKPTAAAVDNALRLIPSSVNNANVIAYAIPFFTPPHGASISRANNSIMMNNVKGESLTTSFRTSTIPHINTFSNTTDRPGAYKATVTLTSAAI